jgi:hypothetical protein
MSEVQTKAQRSQEQLDMRNGPCLALSQRNESGTCACEAWELVKHADGFPTCACGHTRWAHGKSFIEGHVAALL